jgi:hypothetical protein
MKQDTKMNKKKFQVMLFPMQESSLDGLFSSRPRPLLPRRQIVNRHELHQDLGRHLQYSIVYECWEVWDAAVLIYMHAWL